MRCQFSIWLLKKPEIIFLLKWIALSEMTDSIFHLSNGRSMKQNTWVTVVAECLEKTIRSLQKVENSLQIENLSINQ